MNTSEMNASGSKVAEAGVNAAMSSLARNSGYTGVDLVAVPPTGEFSVLAVIDD